MSVASRGYILAFVEGIADASISGMDVFVTIPLKY